MFLARAGGGPFLGTGPAGDRGDVLPIANDFVGPVGDGPEDTVVAVDEEGETLVLGERDDREERRLEGGVDVIVPFMKGGGGG